MDNGHCYVRESTNNHHHLNTVVDNLRQSAGSFSFISHHHNHHQNSHDNYTVRSPYQTEHEFPDHVHVPNQLGTEKQYHQRIFQE